MLRKKMKLVKGSSIGFLRSDPPVSTSGTQCLELIWLRQIGPSLRAPCEALWPDPTGQFSIVIWASGCSRTKKGIPPFFPVVRSTFFFWLKWALQDDIEGDGIPLRCSCSRWRLWQRKIAPFDRATVLRTGPWERGDLPQPESAQDSGAAGRKRPRGSLSQKTYGGPFRNFILC